MYYQPCHYPMYGSHNNNTTQYLTFYFAMVDELEHGTQFEVLYNTLPNYRKEDD